MTVVKTKSEPKKETLKLDPRFRKNFHSEDSLLIFDEKGEISLIDRRTAILLMDKIRIERERKRNSQLNDAA